jgi:endonuclease/exonuclease/phosphatase family metal-dependent hydrolase
MAVPPDAVSSMPRLASNRSSFRVATFNAGLAVGVVALASERVEPIARALPTLDADLLCLQEVWLDEHWQRLVAATAASFPHAVRIPADRPHETVDVALPPEAACSAAQVAPIAQCAKRNCAGLVSDRLGACVLGRCRTFTERISDECASCLAMHPTGSLASIVAPCVDKSAAKATMPTSSLGPVAYGGSYGLGVLTRETVVTQSTLRFEPELNARGAIHVRLDTEALGEVDVFCTHLTPDIAVLSPPAGRTWGGVHAAEVGALLQWIGEHSDARRPTLLIGDLNTGPPVGAFVRGPLADHYARIVAAGFTNALTAQRAPPCTFCDANPLNGGRGSGGSIIDHVLTRRFAGPIEVESVLREPVHLSVDGKDMTTAYSDHYGLLAILRSAR